MKNKQAKLLLILLCAIALAACAPDPRREAKSFETRTLAEQEALDRTQAREQTAALNQITIQKAQREEAVKQSGIESMKALYNSAIKLGGYAIIITLVIVIISVGRGLSTAIEGFGRAAAISAEFKANQVWLDPVTRQYPLIRQIHGPRWMMENPNTGQVLFLDEKNEPHRMLIAAMAAVQHTGLLAREASDSQDPAGVSIIQPLILDEMENAS